MSSSSNHGASQQVARSAPALLLLLILTAVEVGAETRMEPRDEVRVTIGFLLNFAKFTEWPETAPAVKEFPLCVVADDVLADSMRRLVGDRTVQGMPISIITAKTADELRTCRLAFFGTDARRAASHLRALARMPVLTVSTAKDFLAHGGMIELFIQDNRMRFAISRSALEAGQLRMSAELQELASVR